LEIIDNTWRFSLDDKFCKGRHVQKPNGYNEKTCWNFYKIPIKDYPFSKKNHYFTFSANIILVLELKKRTIFIEQHQVFQVWNLQDEAKFLTTIPDKLNVFGIHIKLTSIKSKNSGFPKVPLGNAAGGSPLLWWGWKYRGFSQPIRSPNTAPRAYISLKKHQKVSLSQMWMKWINYLPVAHNE
jgi:hypothetical protein